MADSDIEEHSPEQSTDINFNFPGNLFNTI